MGPDILVALVPTPTVATRNSEVSSCLAFAFVGLQHDLCMFLNTTRSEINIGHHEQCDLSARNPVQVLSDDGERRPIIFIVSG
jgi:hypothetical protein